MKIQLPYVGFFHLVNTIFWTVSTVLKHLQLMKSAFYHCPYKSMLSLKITEP